MKKDKLLQDKEYAVYKFREKGVINAGVWKYLS